MFYSVYAYQDGKTVCEIATVGRGLPALDAVLFARDLRDEFPSAVVAILPAK
ncbi:hypothetical protein ACWC0A_37865 [Streptomyces scopuliridis]